MKMNVTSFMQMNPEDFLGFSTPARDAPQFNRTMSLEQPARNSFARNYARSISEPVNSDYFTSYQQSEDIRSIFPEEGNDFREHLQSINFASYMCSAEHNTYANFQPIRSNFKKQKCIESQSPPKLSLLDLMKQIEVVEKNTDDLIYKVNMLKEETDTLTLKLAGENALCKFLYVLLQSIQNRSIIAWNGSANSGQFRLKNIDVLAKLWAKEKSKNCIKKKNFTRSLSYQVKIGNLEKSKSAKNIYTFVNIKALRSCKDLDEDFDDIDLSAGCENLEDLPESYWFHMSDSSSTPDEDYYSFTPPLNTSIMTGECNLNNTCVSSDDLPNLSDIVPLFFDKH